VHAEFGLPSREPVHAPPRVHRRRWPWVVGLVAVALLATRWMLGQPGTGATPPSRAPAPVPVVAATARVGDLPVYLTGLGSVTAFNTVTVKSRVDGQITRIAFQEGQFVHEGDLLAEIDPRPFQVQLEQAQGQLARDEAQLRDATVTLARYRELFGQGVVSRQEVDDQAAKAGQFQGAIRVDQAQIDNAALQLTYARVTAPISGRAGLRLVDVGNVVHANDTGGIVVLTQLRPIAVLFTVPEDSLPPVMRGLASGEPLRVEAFDRAGQTRLATGSLLTADNRIDQATGTTRLKAIFPNDDDALFPNQFVNVRLLLDVRHDAVIAPIAAVQRGPQGTFMFVVKHDQTVEVRPVTVGPVADPDAAVEHGLAVGDIVVVDGVDKLRAGSPVQLTTRDTSAPARRPGA
jgi:membrane fusion protein, multidrug efflux system